MSDTLDIVFDVKINFNREFLDDVINTLVVNGCEYNKWFLGGYEDKKKGDFVYEDEIDGDSQVERLEKALKILFNQKYIALNLGYMLDDGPCDFTLFIIPMGNQNVWHIRLSLDMAYIDEYENKKSTNNAISFLKLGKSIFQFLHPSIGFGDICQNVNRLYINKKSEILWATFLESRIISKIGRDKILKAPVWRIEELKEDGILLILGRNPLYNESNVYYQVNEYFASLIDLLTEEMLV